MDLIIDAAKTETTKQIVLRDYQREAVDKVKGSWLRGKNQKQLIVLATGGGKTIVFAELANWIIQAPGRVLVLAHRDELLGQAEEKIRWVVGGGVKIAREQAQEYATLDDQIVVASVATLGRAPRSSGAEDTDTEALSLFGQAQADSRFNDRMSRFPRDHFKLVIIDEAHHATASTYQNIIEYFVNGQPTWMLGVTATPKRSDKDSLKDVFDSVAYKKDLLDLTRMGYLAPVVNVRVSSKSDLTGVRTTAGDYNLKDLAQAVDNKERNDLVVNTYLERYRGRQCIIYATSVEHAENLDAQLRSHGVTCTAISGDMDKEARKEAIKAFLKGEMDVLTNYGVLTEGFDCEPLSVIINARPTKSMLLLTQIIGRGTRLYPGKKSLEFVEIIDQHADDTATSGRLFGFSQEWNCQGHDYIECLNTAEQLQKQKEYFNPYACASWMDMLDKFSKVSQDKPDFHGVKPWVDHRYRYFVTRDGNIRLTHKQEDRHYIVLVTEDGLGGVQASFTWKVAYGSETAIAVFTGDTQQDVVSKFEKYVMAHPDFSSWDRLLNINAEWRKRAEGEPCTDKQWALIQKWKLTNLSKDKVSKNDAINMLGIKFNQMSNRK